MDIEFTNITKLMQMLEEVAPGVYDAYVTQAIMSGRVRLAWAIFVLICAVVVIAVLVVLAIHYQRKQKIVDELNAAAKRDLGWNYREIDLWDGEGIIAGVLFCVFGAITLLIWFILEIGIAYKMINNPEYYAISNLISDIAKAAN